MNTNIEYKKQDQKMSSFKLPTDIEEAQVLKPKSLLLYAQPKEGKTTCVAELTVKRNFLLIDLENNSEHVKGRKYSILRYKKEKGLDKLTDAQAFIMLLKDIQSAGNPYEGLIIDTTTKLEEYAKEWAMKEWNQTPMGIAVQDKRKEKGLDVIRDPYNIPGEKGSPGYGLVREKFLYLKEEIERTADLIVYTAHTKVREKTKSFDEDDTVEVQIKEIDLTGQLKRIMAQHVSGVGYLYRVGNVMKVSFKKDDETKELGIRNPQLDNYEGDLDWDKIYLEN